MQVPRRQIQKTACNSDAEKKTSDPLSQQIFWGTKNLKSKIFFYALPNLHNLRRYKYKYEYKYKVHNLSITAGRAGYICCSLSQLQQPLQTSITHLH